MSCVLLHVVHIGVFVYSFILVECEVFTAVTDLKNLVHTHENVIGNIELYIKAEENRLKLLKSHLKLHKDGHEKMSSDAHKYVDNPINAFTLIKRLSTDFDWLKTIASEPSEFVWDRKMLYPTEEDLIGAAVAIARLQLVYKLNTTLLAEGNLQGVFGSSMTASDCYNLALMLYKQEGPNYKSLAAQWFEMALEKLNSEQNENTFTATEVMTYIIKSYHRSNIYSDSEAYKWAEKLHALKPNTSTDSIMKFYKNAIEQNMNDVNSTDVDLWNAYCTLCSSENVPAANTSKWHCSYLRNIPFLKLAPIKMEEVHKNPNVFIFYDVLSDDDFQIIKTIAGPKLERAKINNGDYTDNRIGKSAWLLANTTAVAKLRQRTADFTGLSMLFAEQLQVFNYGIGGHFDWHYDAYDSGYFDEELGNRIATVLFYMSEVSQGGATVFANLNLTVTPKKGSAVYWENLHPSGELDRRTLHAACPVLYGSKWVSNIWIHEGGQELSRPCPAV